MLRPCTGKPRFKTIGKHNEDKREAARRRWKGSNHSSSSCHHHGSGSDWDTMKFTSKHSASSVFHMKTRVVSAHRTPDLLFKYAFQRGENAGLKSSSPVQAAPRIFPA